MNSLISFSLRNDSDRRRRGIQRTAKYTQTHGQQLQKQRFKTAENVAKQQCFK